jgi:hypothetical protein
VDYWAHAGGFLAGGLLAMPVWLRLGGPGFWRQTQGVPPHPEAAYRIGKTRVPSTRRSGTRPGGAGPWG